MFFNRAFAFYVVVVMLMSGLAAIFAWEPEYAYMPPEEKVLRAKTAAKARSASRKKVYDLSGNVTDLSKRQNMYTLRKHENGSVLGERTGLIDESFLSLGRETFYKETFGNEVFLTDIMGIIDGPLTVTNIMKAIIQLRGRGTDNLRVEIAKDVNIGGKTFKKGQRIDTGIDVPKGAWAPLGMPVKLSEGRVKVGISCAVCHATVDSRTMKVVEGAPNRDLNAGLLMALASNSTAYFTHTDVDDLAEHLKDMKRSHSLVSICLRRTV